MSETQIPKDASAEQRRRPQPTHIPLAVQRDGQGHPKETPMSEALDPQSEQHLTDLKNRRGDRQQQLDHEPQPRDPVRFSTPANWPPLS